MTPIIHFILKLSVFFVLPIVNVLIISLLIFSLANDFDLTGYQDKLSPFSSHTNIPFDI